jgi:hypothetical protein
MAKIIDVRNSDGVIAFLGDSMIVPVSSDFNMITVPGSIRYNPTTSAIEVYAPNSSQDVVWSPMVTAAQITADVQNYYLPVTGGTVSGNIIVTGNINANGTITAPYISGQATSALYAADIAERYHADSQYTPGTVLVVGGENEVTISRTSEDIKVAGIVSTEPAYKMNVMAGNDETHPYIALKGKVPCNVIGPVSKGDHLCTSNVPGYATSAPIGVDPRACFAIALESCAEGMFQIDAKI